MVTYDKLITFAGACSQSEYEAVKKQAKKKLANIISRFGDEEGERLTDRYLLQLMSEELRAKRVSGVLFADYAHKRVCPVTA